MDAVFLTINGERHYLWCAVDQDGMVLDIWSSGSGTKKPRRNSPEAAQGLHLRAAGDHYGQAQKLRGRQARNSPGRGTPPASLSEQSGGKLIPTYLPAGATDAGGQVPGTGAAVPCRIRSHCPAFPTTVMRNINISATLPFFHSCACQNGFPLALSGRAPQRRSPHRTLG